MQNKIFASFEDALRDIPNGASILVAGFAGPGSPHNLLVSLYELGTTDLTLIANSIGGGSGLPRPGQVSLGSFVEQRRVKKAVAAFTASTHPSQRSALEEQNQAGLVETEITPQGTLADRIRAGGSGIPAFYTPAGVGTEVAEGKEHRVFNGRTYLMEEAITADYALLRAWKADHFGNLIYRRSARNFNPIMAMAATCTIVEVEEIVETGTLDPDAIHTPGVWVHRLEQIPPDGIFQLER